MKKIIFLLLHISLLFSSVAFAQNTQCFVKINTGDCVNCLSVLQYVSKIDSSLRVRFVVQELDKKHLKKAFEEVFKIPYDPQQILVSDSIFRSINPSDNSSVNLFNHQTQKNEFSFLLCNITSQYKILNALGKSYANVVFKENLSGLELSNKITLKTSQQKVYIFDELFNVVYVYDLERKQISHKITEKTFDAKQIHQLIFKDSLTAENLKSIQSFSTKPIIHLENIVVEADKLLLLFTYTSIEKREIEGKKVLALMPNFMLSSIDSSGQLEYVHHIKNINRKPLDINQVGLFFTGDIQNFYCQISMYEKPNAKDKRFFLGKYILKNNRYVFDSPMPFELPEVLGNTGYSYAYVGKKQNLIYFNYCNYFVDTKTKQNFELNFEGLTPNDFTDEKQVKINFMLIDVHNSENLIKCLTYSNKKYQIFVFDKQTKVLKNKQTIPNVSNNIKSELGFMPDGRLVYLSQTDELIALD